MKKAFALIVFLCCLLFATTSFASLLLEYDDGIHNYTGALYKLSVNGNLLSDLPLEPIIFNDRALVPVREVFEALGAQVFYENETKKITISYKEKNIGIQIDSNEATIGGEIIPIPDGLTPKLIAKWGDSAKTMVPVRFVSESIGLLVDFDSVLELISVSEPGNPGINTVTEIIDGEENGTIMIEVHTTDSIKSHDGPYITSGGVLYADIPNTRYQTPNSIPLNYPYVHSVRVGAQDFGTRIAIDLDKPKVKNYSVYVFKNNLIFYITIDENADSGGTADDTGLQFSERPRPSILSGGKKYVVLDAGHGGKDSGAISNIGGTVYEKDIALSVVTKIKNILVNCGIDVIMTRSGDTYPTLGERCEIANNIGAAMFLSVHLNATASETTTAQGMEIYYCETNNSAEYGLASSQMAAIILARTLKSTGAPSRGVKSGNLYVTRETFMPANLIEIGFINNPDELELLKNNAYQDLVAQGIADGIIEVLNKITLP